MHQTQLPRIGDGRDWHFVNGRWQDGEDGLLAVPDDLCRTDGDGLQGHHYAFRRGLCYQDVRVRFAFRLTANRCIYTCDDSAAWR